MHAPSLCLRLLPLVALLPAASGAAPLATLEEVDECIRSNRPDLSIEQTYAMESVDRIGSKRTSQGKIYWKKFDDGLSKALVRVTGPSDVRGTAALIIEREDRDAEIFSYLPELGKVRRVTERTVTGSFMGSDFSYEDLERLQGMSEDRERKLEPLAERDGRPVYVIEAEPGRGEESEYSRVRNYIDQETCVAIYVECFGHKGELAKTFTAPLEEIRQVDGRRIPHMLTAVDELKGTRTELRVDEVEVDVDLPKRHFTATALERRR